MNRTSTTVAALAALAGFGMTGAVNAADLLGVAPAYVAPVQYSVDYGAPNDKWTGFYLGAHIGGLTSNDFSDTNSAWGGGLHAGYTHQFDTFVLGAELQANFADVLRYELASGAGLSEEWSIAAKGRAGVALDNTLLYGTAGLSVAELAPTGATTSPAETHLGGAFGVGVEQALGNGFSLRAEYQQTRYFDVSSAVGGLGRTDDLTNHAITAGLSYRF